MIYAQFYQRSALDADGQKCLPLIEACGDRSVIIYDGRLRRADIGRDAAMECAKRGYAGWRIHKGETFTRSVPVSELRYVHAERPITPSAASASYGA